MFYGIGFIMADRRSKCYIAGMGIIDLFCSCDLEFNPMTLYELDPYSLAANTNFIVCQGFRKLSSDKQNRKYIYHATIIKFSIVRPCLSHARLSTGRIAPSSDRSAARSTTHMCTCSTRNESSDSREPVQKRSS